ncbi:MAG: hypothetical protein JWM04_574, partial [Verrucomicrobiales bacterium]|nr:hypothetical protein [Verrucomicrobiales bacterium]
MVEPKTRATPQALMEKAVIELRELRSRVKQLERSTAEPVAIVGMGCRFPGDIHSPDDYWSLLLEGREAIGEVPKDRWDSERWYSADKQEPGRIYCRHGGFLKDIDQFDPGFFGITPREANLIDPQQRLVLEVSWEAMERASLTLKELQRKTTGVFIGASGWDFATMQMIGLDPANMDPYFGTGSALSVIAGRLSFVLGLTGPSLVVDTACSSSLVSVHLACQSLRLGECDVALAGGVSLILRPEVTLNFCKAGMLAPDGHCKPFAEGANGYLRSEGCGMIVLKRLSVAIADGDSIVALISGSAENHDGRSSGLTVPNGLSQQSVIRKALRQSVLEPNDISYVEAHGTGTSLGDPIEAMALGAVFKGRTDRLKIGSVKGNLGHLEGAAGIAGLIKVALSLQHKQWPGQLNCDKPSTQIPWSDLPVEINQVRSEWFSVGKGRAAGVSSFGFSGTNAHIILQEAPENNSRVKAEPTTNAFLISARSENALLKMAARYQAFLEHNQHDEFSDVCFSLSCGRSLFKYRLGLLASSNSEAAKTLSCFINGQPGQTLWANLKSWENGIVPSGISERSCYDFVTQSEFDPGTLFINGNHRRVALPTYPFERSRFWVDHGIREEGHPLLGSRLELPGSDEIRFETEFSDRRPGFLMDHKFFGMVVVPAMVFVEVAMEAGRRMSIMPRMENIQIEQAMVIQPLEKMSVQTVLKTVDGFFHVFIYGRNIKTEGSSWKLHFSAFLKTGVPEMQGAPALADDSQAENIAIEEYYMDGKKRGIDLGNSFQCLRGLQRSNGTATATVGIPTILESETGTYGIHPVVLDGCLQALGACFPK